MWALRISILADYLNVDHNIRQSTKIDFTGPLDNLHCDTHSKNVVLYSRLSVLVERMTWKLWAINGVRTRDNHNHKVGLYR